LTLAFHTYANLFPLIEGQDFYDLAEDIRVNGLHDRVDLVEVEGGYQVLDGRNRYRALMWLMTTGEALGEAWGRWSGEALTIERLANYDDVHLYELAPVDNDAEALAFALSKNLKRRHLDESQRAMVAARLPRVEHGGDRGKPQIRGLSTERRAALLNVGRGTVETAQIVQDRATPELVEAVDRGAIAVSAAAELAAQPIERQAEILKNLPRDETGKLTPDVKKALAPVMKEIRAEKVAAKKERRAEREEKLGRRLQALPAKTFGVAIEDFEWDHEPWSRDTGVLRHPSMHYETAADAHTPEEIVARCGERLACLADDCILFKWATIPHLAIAIRVMELQGFRYVTSLVWNKERPGEARGPGYWFTGEHELVLVGVRGKVVPPATAHFRSNFSTPVGEHSEKPSTIHEIIEFHWPNTPKVEFNARCARPRWTAWGFDAPEIADGGEGQPVVDQPALPTEGILPDNGKVDSAASTPSACAAAAVPPADRPGANSQAPEPHPLDIPDFLRRTPQQAEMDLTRRDRAPPEIVDGALQTRLPLAADELPLHAALTSIAAGEAVDSWSLRDLESAGFVHIGTSSVKVTDAGQAFLAQLVTPAPAAAIEARA
jgi:N6-adenosine-specific RNA methylase IME4